MITAIGIGFHCLLSYSSQKKKIKIKIKPTWEQSWISPTLPYTRSSHLGLVTEASYAKRASQPETSRKNQDYPAKIFRKKKKNLEEFACPLQGLRL